LKTKDRLSHQAIRESLRRVDQRRGIQAWGVQTSFGRRPAPNGLAQTKWKRFL